MTRGETGHGRGQNIGVLLINLGTPDAPTTKSVRRYLRQFLSDERVIESPRWLWQLILNGIVLPFRAPRTAAAYRRIWGDDGSPLMAISQKQKTAVEKSFLGLPIKTALAMRYGAPSIADGLQKLLRENCRRLAVLPLYPQYAGSTTGSVFVEVCRRLAAVRAVPHFRFIGGYGDDPRYIGVLADSIRAHFQQNGAPQLLIFSFHGTPLKMLLDGDPYYCWCQKTARLTAENLRLNDSQWTICFQSRFGRALWLTPGTDKTLQTLPAKGVKNVQVVCPSFAADCLETLDEIKNENKKIFINNGGEQFSFIPSLNDDARHINFLRQLLMDNIGDWLQSVERENKTEKLAQQKTRAETLAAAIGENGEG